ncbi:methylated-DNA--protein-cysteine methyltransferase isoform X2 [Ascaphus truei]|uniref:methylated-DNA--protein-cysteine methyltransferase isoform X2 n=1 Tax=Ascaphus truei TaxID=8439 RepID=UPI003F5A1F54
MRIQICHAMALKNIDCKVMEMTINSTLGEIQVYGCEKGIHELKLQKDAVAELGANGASVAFEVCKGPQEMTAPLKQCTTWLQAYFCEPWMTEKLPVPAFHHPLFEKGITVNKICLPKETLPAINSFTKRVLLALLNKVKIGETVSYKELAEIAGNEKAARAVGGAMRSNPLPIIIPCHRVICSNGNIGNYMGGKGNQLKPWLLAHEKLLKEM